jgi:hypothetical protein
MGTNVAVDIQNFPDLSDGERELLLKYLAKTVVYMLNIEASINFKTRFKEIPDEGDNTELKQQIRQETVSKVKDEVSPLDIIAFAQYELEQDLFRLNNPDSDDSVSVKEEFVEKSYLVGTFAPRYIQSLREDASILQQRHLASLKGDQQ